MRVLLIFLAALAVRMATAVWVNQPGYMDSFYYYAIGESLYRGHGFVENFVWNYLYVPSSIPHPSNLYWMPLPSVAVALSFAIFGESFRAAQVPMVLIAGTLPVISYIVTKDILADGRHAVSAAVFTIFSAPYIVYWTVPDGFGLFAVFGSLSLYFTYRGLRDNSWCFVAGGAMAGLAQLTRADGVLLALVVFGVSAWRAFSTCERTAPRRYLPVLASIFACLLVLSPWLWRNWQVAGSPLPSYGFKAAFLREYNDMFAYGHSVDLSYYLESGWGEILRSKASALFYNFWTFDLLALIYLLPFVLLGWWSLRRRVEMLPVSLYASSLYVLASLVFTHPGPRGLFLHSGAVLLPFLFGPAVVGLDNAVAFAARFRRHWSVPTAQVNFTRVSLGLSAILSLALAIRALSGWDNHYRLYQQIAARIETRVPAAETVIVVDPPAYYYVTKKPSVVFTNDGVAQLVDLAVRFQASHIVLEPAHPKPLSDLYIGRESHPALELEETFPDHAGKPVKLYRVVPFSQ